MMQRKFVSQGWVPCLFREMIQYLLLQSGREMGGSWTSRSKNWKDSLYVLGVGILVRKFYTVTHFLHEPVHHTIIMISLSLSLSLLSLSLSDVRVILISVCATAAAETSIATVSVLWKGILYTYVFGHNFFTCRCLIISESAHLIVTHWLSPVTPVSPSIWTESVAIYYSWSIKYYLTLGSSVTMTFFDVVSLVNILRLKWSMLLLS